MKPLMLVVSVITVPFPKPQQQCLLGTFHCYLLSEILHQPILFGLLLSRDLFSQPRVPSLWLASRFDGEATHADPRTHPVVSSTSFHFPIKEAINGRLTDATGLSHVDGSFLRSQK